MISAARIVALFFTAGLAVVHPGAAAAFNDVTAAPGGVAAGRDITGTVNIGLSPEQVKELTEAAARGATDPLTTTIIDLSKRLGVTEDATKTLLRIVGEQDVPLERLSETLSRVANDYKRLQAQAAALSPENPTARGLVTQAKTEIDVGRLEHAHELLRQATQVQIAAAQQVDQFIQQAQAAKEAQMLGAARSTATEGDVALTERHYAQAAELYHQAMDYVPTGFSNEQRRYLEQEAGALYRQGDERGDNGAAASAIDRHRSLVRRADHAADPLDWARTQSNLAIALAMLGERETGTAQLDEAVVAFRAALQEWSRDRVPLYWATTQNNLGVALKMLGERESGTARLHEAVAAYRAALEERTRDRVPLDWAQTQNNLGNALRALGERESGTARLEEAVAAFRAALEERTRDRVPLDWARTQNNLGNALQTLGERESGTARLAEAVAAFRAALQEWTRGRVPLDWAQTQNNLGNTLRALGERESGTAQLEEAVADFRAALEERTRNRVPLDWAQTQNNLGNALQTLGERESGTVRLAEAVSAWDACLAVTTTVWPSEWVQDVRDRRDKVQSEIEQRSAR